MIKFIKSHAVQFILLCIIAIAIIARLYLYGDIRLSIGNAETHSYINSSSAPLFSWNMFAGKRLFTTNLIYKIALDHKACPLMDVNHPAAQQHNDREIQPCFDGIAVAQTFLSILGWCLLTWTTSRWLKSPALKISAAVLIIFFAFTPQIAEWDSNLSPESLSLSLFMITFALLQEIVFRTTQNKASTDARGDRLLIAGFLLVFALWIFVRDVHLYSILVTLVLLAPFFLVRTARKSRTLFVVFVLLLGLFALGFVSARDGRRAQIPLTHSFDDYILPYPSRMKFFDWLGMPDVHSPSYQAWFDAHATMTYGAFILSHPGFVINTLWYNKDYFRANYEQPFFNTRQSLLLMVGEIVHPETLAVFFLDLLLFALLCYKALRDKDRNMIGWVWMAAWFLCCNGATLLVSFFGDTAGVLRHISPRLKCFDFSFGCSCLLLQMGF